MKNLVAPLLLILVLSSCSEQSDCCTNIELSINVEIQNANGADMLNPSTSGSISNLDIEVYYEIDGRFETYRSLNKGAILDNPKGFDLQSKDTSYFLRVFSNPTPGNSVVTLIRIKDHPEVRLVTKVEDNHGRQVTELRYLDQLVWSNTMSSKQYPVVTVKFD